MDQSIKITGPITKLSESAVIRVNEESRLRAGPPQFDSWQGQVFYALHSVHTCSRAHPDSYTIGTGESALEYEAMVRDVELTTHRHLVPRSTGTSRVPIPMRS
jgi:hypothetical protein